MVSNSVCALIRLLRDRDGISALEYGLIAAAIVVMISILLPGINERLSGIFSVISNGL